MPLTTSPRVRSRARLLTAATAACAITAPAGASGASAASLDPGDFSAYVPPVSSLELVTEPADQELAGIAAEEHIGPDDPDHAAQT